MPIELSSPHPRARKPFRVGGRFVLIAFLAFLGVVIGVNTVMLTLALRSMPGVDTRSTYEVSQHFNETIARRDEQDARGWKTDLQVRREGDAAMLTATMTDRDGQPLTGLSVTVRMRHPATTARDRAADLAERAPGLYEARLERIADGSWRLDVEARRAGEEVFLSHGRVMLRER